MRLDLSQESSYAKKLLLTKLFKNYGSENELEGLGVYFVLVDSDTGHVTMDFKPPSCVIDTVFVDATTMDHHSALIPVKGENAPLFGLKGEHLNTSLVAKLVTDSDFDLVTIEEDQEVEEDQSELNPKQEVATIEERTGQFESGETTIIEVAKKLEQEMQKKMNKKQQQQQQQQKQQQQQQKEENIEEAPTSGSPLLIITTDSTTNTSKKPFGLVGYKRPYEIVT